jgi:hypothetical protein
LLTLFLITSEAVAQTHLLWIAYGTFSSFGTLAYSQAAAGFPVALSGRVNTAFNLMVFIGAFGVQWGLGLLIDLLQTGGQSVAAAHRSAFSRPPDWPGGGLCLVLPGQPPGPTRVSAIERQGVEATLDLRRHPAISGVVRVAEAAR